MKKLITLITLISITFIFSVCETTPEDQAYYDRTADSWHEKVDVYRDGQDYPNYHPHVTLAYVKNETLPHVDGETMFNGKNFVFDEFVYSTADEKYDIKKCD